MERAKAGALSKEAAPWISTAVPSAAARHLTFSQTAEALYLSQPTGNHIKQLERELAASCLSVPVARCVLRRPVSSLRHTPAGSGTRYRSSSPGWPGEERLSVAAAYGSSLRTPVDFAHVSGTYADRPDGYFVLVSEEIPAVVANGEAEIGFSRIEPDDPRLTGEILHPDPVIFVAPPCTYNENAAPYRNWQEAVRRFPLITHNHPGYWDDLLLAIDQILPRLFTMVVTQVDITKRLIEEGLGTSFLPRSAVYSEIRTGKMVELPVPELVLPISASWLVFRADKHMTAGAKAFVELARNLRRTDHKRLR